MPAHAQNSSFDLQTRLDGLEFLSYPIAEPAPPDSQEEERLEDSQGMDPEPEQPHAPNNDMETEGNEPEENEERAGGERAGGERAGGERAGGERARSASRARPRRG